MNLLRKLIPGFSFFWLGIVAVALTAALAGLWKVHHNGVVSGRAEVQQKWDADTAATATENTKKLAAATAKSTDLQKRVDKERGTLNAHIRSIDLERDELLRRLRARPARPTESASSVPPDTGPGHSCTGAGLFAPDAEFLVRLAARADAVRARLASCESAYKRAQDAVNSVGEPPH